MRWTRPLRCALALAGIGLLAPYLARVLPEGWLAWALDLAAHWVYLWLPLGLLGLWGLPAWRWRALVLSVLVALPWLALPPSLTRGQGQADVHLVSANLNLDNQNPAPLLAWLADDAPDVLALVELSPGMAKALAPDARWPHQHLLPRDDPFGLGLLSRWPIEQVQMGADASGIPHLRVVLRTPKGLVALWVVHPMPPLSPAWHRQRDAALASIRPLPGMPAVMAGDFNATPWSTAALNLTQGGWRWAGGLAGLRPTWPDGGQAIWGIPIDAVWAHGDWRVIDHTVGPAIGSDHRPVRIRLQLH